MPCLTRARLRFHSRLLALALLASSGFATAQSTCADFEALALEVSGARDSDPADGVARGEKALRDATALQPPCPTGRAMLLGGIASNLQVLGRNPEALERYEQALAVLGTGGKPAQVAFLHRGLGVALVDIESYERALKHYLIALSASDGAGEQVESAKTAGNIGILYSSIGELEKSRDYHRRSLAGFEAVGFEPGIAGALINLGAVAAKFGTQALARGDEAEARKQHGLLRDYNERAQALFAAMGNQRGVAYAASNIGLALDRLGQPQQALPHHQRSLSLRREVGDVFGTINSLLSIATTTTSLQRRDEAVAALDEAATLIPPEAFNLLQEVAVQRVALAEAAGDFRAALFAQREVTRLGELSADADQSSQIAALQDRFDADKAARQIDLLRSKAQVGEAHLQRQRQATQLSVLIAALATGLLLVMLSRYRIGRSSARKLSIAARTDHLTGLPNRRHLIEIMEYEMKRVARGSRTFCLLMVDLDDFKEINDAYGHDAGDAVLREVAERLRGGVRAQDTVARWGGEEFLMLLPESDNAGALTLANKLRERISHEVFVVGPGRKPRTVTLTVGCSEYENGKGLDDCIKAADLALYEGKRQGKDRAASLPVDSGLVPSV
jgi:diguanylate cyclase (GGDEF)-like protein